ncbi:MAG: methionyl-tRNA formyltransferase [Gammaproteobacteria bacterium]
MRCIVIGSVESTRVCLRALAASRGVEVAAVVTLPAELAHRHSDYVNLTSDAAGCGARLLRAGDGNAPEVVAASAAFDPDYLFVVGWSQIVRAPLRATARCGAIGFHPAPLPRFRGRAAIPWTILLDEKITGSTLFWLDEGVDTGPILTQRLLHVALDETATSLYARHMQALEDVLAEVLPRLTTGNAPQHSQDERYATCCAKRVPADGLIDWQQPAEMVWRLIRAVTRPYPGAFTRDTAGRQIILWTAEPWPEGYRHMALPGQVVARFDDSFAVRCGDGRDLRITEFTDAQGEPCPAPRLHARLGGPAAFGADP